MQGGHLSYLWLVTCFQGLEESFLGLLFLRFPQLEMFTAPRLWWRVLSPTRLWPVPPPREGGTAHLSQQLPDSDSSYAKKISKIIWGRGDRHGIANFIVCQMSTSKINPIIAIISFLNDLLTLQNGEMIIAGGKHTSKQIKFRLVKNDTFPLCPSFC